MVVTIRSGADMNPTVLKQRDDRDKHDRDKQHTTTRCLQHQPTNRISNTPQTLHRHFTDTPPPPTQSPPPTHSHLHSMTMVMTIRSGADMNPNAFAQKSLRVLASELTRLNSLPAVRCCRSEGANTSTCMRHMRYGWQAGRVVMHSRARMV